MDAQRCVLFRHGQLRLESLLSAAVLVASVVACSGCLRVENPRDADGDAGIGVLVDTIVTAEPTWSIPDVAPPKGMVLVPGGRTMIGSNDGFANELPMFEVDVPPFFMDAHEVTVAEFDSFVTATGYVTEAEIFGNSAVIDEETKRWTLRDGANWRMPLGPDGSEAVRTHPVTHVSFNDATAFARWAGKRLPTEIEWEHAARGAINDRGRYPSGLQVGPDSYPNANLWQGTFPHQNTAEDGYRYTAAVGEFGSNVLGLMDMSGNVWEWTTSWYRPYADRHSPFEPDEHSARVQRGGSFLCNDSWCHGFRVSARGQSTPESSHYHVGFRCVRDIAIAE